MTRHTVFILAATAVILAVLYALPAAAQCDPACSQVPEPPISSAASSTIYLPAVAANWHAWYTDAELEAMLIYQIGALSGIARAEGGVLTHVKPHGALNNMACEDAALAATVARAVKAFDATLILLAPALSQLQRAGEAAGLAVGIEVFADRAYTDEGNLVPRSKPGAVLHAAEDCVAHVLRFVEAGGIVCASGKILKTPFHSICVHGDGPQAVAAAAAIRDAMGVAGVALVPLPQAIGG